VDSSEVKGVYAILGVENEVGWDHPQHFRAEKNLVSWEVPPYTCLEDVEDLLITAGAEAVLVEPCPDAVGEWRELLPDYLKDFAEGRMEYDEEDEKVNFITKMIH